MEKSMDGFDFKLPWLFRLIGPLALKSVLKKRMFKAGVKNPPTWRQLHIVHCSHHLGFLIPK